MKKSSCLAMTDRAFVGRRENKSGILSPFLNTLNVLCQCRGTVRGGGGGGASSEPINLFCSVTVPMRNGRADPYVGLPTMH